MKYRIVQVPGSSSYTIHDEHGEIAYFANEQEARAYVAKLEQSESTPEPPKQEEPKKPSKKRKVK